MAKVIAIWGIVAIAPAIVAGIVASIRRRDHSFWAAWSFLVPPMLLILLLMPSHKGPRQRRPGIDEIEDRQAH
jgi:H+/Cl- antiporter ClcA